MLGDWAPEEELVRFGCLLMAHSGLFEQARRVSAIGGKADIPRNGSTDACL